MMDSAVSRLLSTPALVTGVCQPGVDKPGVWRGEGGNRETEEREEDVCELKHKSLILIVIDYVSKCSRSRDTITD